MELSSEQQPSTCADHAKCKDVFVFRLYVSEQNVTAALAIKNLARICEVIGQESCQVEIIDVHAQPKRAEKDRVFAVPTLIKSEPFPVVRILGDLRDSVKILESLGCASVQKD